MTNNIEKEIKMNNEMLERVKVYWAARQQIDLESLKNLDTIVQNTIVAADRNNNATLADVLKFANNNKQYNLSNVANSLFDTIQAYISPQHKVLIDGFIKGFGVVKDESDFNKRFKDDSDFENRYK